MIINKNKILTILNWEYYFGNLYSWNLQLFYYWRDKPILLNNIKNENYQYKNINVNKYSRNENKRELLLISGGLNFSSDGYYIHIINRLSLKYDIIIINQIVNKENYRIFGDNLDMQNLIDNILLDYDKVFLMGFSAGVGGIIKYILDNPEHPKIKGVLNISNLILPFYFKTRGSIPRTTFNSFERTLNLNKRFNGEVCDIINHLEETYHDSYYLKYINNYNVLNKDFKKIKYQVIYIFARDDDFIPIEQLDGQIPAIKNTNIGFLLLNRGYHTIFMDRNGYTFIPFVEDMIKIVFSNGFYPNENIQNKNIQIQNIEKNNNKNINLLNRKKYFKYHK